MERKYTSKFGTIIKKCPGLNEYWFKGKLIARGSCISGPNPDCKPSKDDWEICVWLRK